jgi:PAS domain S-box-containing protein
MKINIQDIIDFRKVDALLEGFNKSTGFVTAILDLEGNVLSKSGWRHICTDFHRVNTDSCRRCTVSDTLLANRMAAGEEYHFYECLNGLVDVAVPITVNGVHFANLFSGQFFFEKPDIEFFRKQAAEFGFDQKKYLDALAEVPVVSRDKVKTVMDFLLNMTYLISDLGYQKLELTELNRRLAESENEYRLFFENNPQPMWVCDPVSMDFLEVNEATVNKYGYRREEFRLMNLRDIMIADEGQGVVEKTEHGGDTSFISGNWKHISKNGREFLVEIVSHNIVYKSKNARLTLATDITQRKLAEHSMEESEKRYRSLFENMNSGFVLFEVVQNEQGFPVDLLILAANRGFEITTGLNQSTATGKYLTKVLPGIEKDTADWISTYSRVALTGEPIQFEQDSELLDIYYAISAFQPAIRQCAVTFVDITERKRTEKEIIKLNDLLEQRIRERTNELSDLYNNAPCGYHSLDKNGVVIHINDTELKMLGYEREEVVNKIKMSDIMTPESQKLLKEAFPLFQKQGFLLDYELELIK